MPRDKKCRWHKQSSPSARTHRVRSWSSWGDVRSSSGPWDVLSTLPPTNKSNWNHQTLKIKPILQPNIPFLNAWRSRLMQTHISSVSLISAQLLQLLPLPVLTAVTSKPLSQRGQHQTQLSLWTSHHPPLLIITKSCSGRLFNLFVFFFCGGGCNIAELKVQQCLLSLWEQELSKNILFRA